MYCNNMKWFDEMLTYFNCFSGPQHDTEKLQSQVTCSLINWHTAASSICLLQRWSRATPCDRYNLKYVCTLITFIYTTDENKKKTYVKEYIDVITARAVFSFSFAGSFKTGHNSETLLHVCI